MGINLIIKILLIVCVFAGIISEIITISMPDKVLGIAEKNPDEILNGRFYKVIFFFSAFYFLGIILMFFSGVDIFRMYAVWLLLVSFTAWILRKWLIRFRYLQITESTVCLIVLFDVLRTITKNIVK